MTARRLVILISVLLLAVQVVRNAAVAALATLHPAAAATLWSGHPAVEISLGMSQIGRAARERRTIDPRVFEMIDDAAVKSPLSPEPFLVRGVQAQTAGDANSAREAYLAAQSRDPRSLPAAYFLADYYLRAGKPLEGLTQTALLARLSPQGTDAIAPFVAAYAVDRANWPAMRTLFRSQESLEDGVLLALAHDGRNTAAILALADASHRRPDSPWVPTLLNSLVASGNYGQARAIWSTISRADVGAGLVYDPSFTAPEAPPPFNWSLAASTIGLTERQPGKGLHVIFYGNEDGVLARELLVLSPGTYRLQMRPGGSQAHPELLRWSIRCDKASEPLGSISLDQMDAHGWTFDIPANCGAQWIELSGRSGDISQQSDVTIHDINLTSAGHHA